MPEISGVVVATHAERPIRAHDVLALYRSEGWWPERTLQQVSSVLADSTAVAAWHEDEVVGFARAVSDGVLRAYVEDVIVSPRRRGAGIGHALVSCLLEQLGPIPVVTLFCSRDLASFYESTGFRSTGQVVLHRT